MKLVIQNMKLVSTKYEIGYTKYEIGLRAKIELRVETSLEIFLHHFKGLRLFTILAYLIKQMLMTRAY